MTVESPEDNAWLRALIQRSPLLPEATLKRHWKKIVPALPVAARYELAAILVGVERDLTCD